MLNTYHKHKRKYIDRTYKNVWKSPPEAIINLNMNRFKKGVDQFIDTIKIGCQEKEEMLGRGCHTLGLI